MRPEPIALILWFFAASATTYSMYWWDKRAATRGRPRTRERTLHLAALLGGWPGALLAQRTLRHKTRDTRFLIVFWTTVALHLAAYALVAAWRLGLLT